MVTIDECVITRFEFGAALEDVIYILDSPQPVEREIESFIIEPACQYEVRYDMYVVNQSN